MRQHLTLNRINANLTTVERVCRLPTTPAVRALRCCLMWVRAHGRLANGGDIS